MSIENKIPRIVHDWKYNNENILMGDTLNVQGMFLKLHIFHMYGQIIYVCVCLSLL